MCYLRLLFMLLAVLLALTQCQFRDPAPILPENQLPPITQTGANTFSCLVNGHPWTPQGYDGTSNYAVSYDSGINRGLLNVRTYRYEKGSKDSQGMNFAILSNCQVGNYSFSDPQLARISFDDSKTTCYWNNSYSATTYRRGTLTITRLDASNGIIAGTFAFTLYKSGCDSLHVTHGRFDYRL
jgi:hypothetical protein